jgi:hypothetical protein
MAVPHAGVLRGPRPPGARHSRGITRKSLVAYLARAEKHPHVPADSAPDIDAEAILELMVHYGSLEFAFQFGQGVATATYDSFHDAFADVPAATSREVRRNAHSIHTGQDLLTPGGGVFGAAVLEPGGG